VDRETAVGWREQVADLEALRLVLGGHSLTLLGYSWGGLLAVLYYLQHPDQVARLALVAPAAIAPEYRTAFDREFATRMAAPEIVAAREALRASGLREREPAAYQKRAFELSVAGYFRDWRDARQLTPFRVTARTQHAVWESLRGEDLRQRLRPLPPSSSMALRPDPHRRFP
jgi:proline iminopeptidase